MNLDYYAEIIVANVIKIIEVYNSLDKFPLSFIVEGVVAVFVVGNLKEWHLDFLWLSCGQQKLSSWSQMPLECTVTDHWSRIWA